MRTVALLASAMTGPSCDNRHTAHTTEHQSVPLSLKYFAECAWQNPSDRVGRNQGHRIDSLDVLTLNDHRNKPY
jgi:hypothetical protein